METNTELEMESRKRKGKDMNLLLIISNAPILKEFNNFHLKQLIRIVFFVFVCFKFWFRFLGFVLSYKNKGLAE